MIEKWRRSVVRMYHDLDVAADALGDRLRREVRQYSRAS
jgi:hypothetical protein